MAFDLPAHLSPSISSKVSSRKSIKSQLAAVSVKVHEDLEGDKIRT